MTTYVIGRVTKNHDPGWVAEYLEKIEPLLLRHGAKVLCRSFSVEKLEGVESPPAAIVLIEFPSAEHARAWYQDEDYGPLIRLRQSGSETEVELLG